MSQRKLLARLRRARRELTEAESAIEKSNSHAPPVAHEDDEDMIEARRRLNALSARVSAMTLGDIRE